MSGGVISLKRKMETCMPNLHGYLLNCNNGILHADVCWPYRPIGLLRAVGGFEAGVTCCICVACIAVQHKIQVRANECAWVLSSCL